MPPAESTSRGQTAVIGSLLLVATVAILVGLLGVVAFGIVDTADDTAPSTAVDAAIDSSDVSVTHASGTVLDVADLEVVLDTPASTLRIPLENFRGPDTPELTAGVRFHLPHGVDDGTVEVQVVHEPSNSVLERDSLSLTDGEVTLAAFDPAATSDYAGGQNGDGSTSVEDGGRTVRLTGNQWKYIDYDYEVTADTMLTFEFKSTAEGDIHGIGLEDDPTTQDSSRVVRVYGTQQWGINVSTETSEPYYRQGDDWRRYTVPLGQLYADNGNLGTASELVVVMDCDPTPAVNSGTPDDRCKSQTDSGDPTATAYFRNIEVYEKDG